MLDQLNEDTVAVVVPAMPQSRRILVGGYSVIDGVALINTPVAQDVRTPVKENYIPRLLAGQTGRKVGLVTLDQVLKGKEGIREALTEVRNDGASVIIVDAITLEDVDQIAQACIELDWDVVAVDPGPFTSKLAYRRRLIQEEQPNIPPAASEEGKTVLIAAGSATPVTKKQKVPSRQALWILCMQHGRELSGSAHRMRRYARKTAVFLQSRVNFGWKAGREKRVSSLEPMTSV